MDSATGLYSEVQVNYVNGISDENLRDHLLYQLRLRDNMELDRNAFEKENTELKNRIREIERKIKLISERDGRIDDILKD